MVWFGLVDLVFNGDFDCIGHIHQSVACRATRVRYFTARITVTTIKPSPRRGTSNDVNVAALRRLEIEPGTWRSAPNLDTVNLFRRFFTIPNRRLNYI